MSIMYQLPCQHPGCNQMFSNKSSGVWQICNRCHYRICHNHAIGVCPQCKYGIIKSYSGTWEKFNKK